jgi:hypothetical protein
VPINKRSDRRWAAGSRFSQFAFYFGKYFLRIIPARESGDITQIPSFHAIHTCYAKNSLSVKQKEQ